MAGYEGKLLEVNLTTGAIKTSTVDKETVRKYIGGQAQLFETFMKAFKRDGGELRLRTRVERIIVENGQVQGVYTDKGVFKAPIHCKQRWYPAYCTQAGGGGALRQELCQPHQGAGSVAGTYG